MHAFDLPYQPFTSTTEVRDERSDSLSDSEDSHHAYLHYVDHSHKSDIETEEDANAALTSQTLNADGTPKRPMNAFMIFARRRRPQLSAENQSMRTGEISKVLSKEWNSMGMAEKQFYLDQAKQLKDNFNNKYPDYVYRRRPNNSRKKRRTEGGVTRNGDAHVPQDLGDDVSTNEAYGEHSPIDTDDGFGEHMADPAYAHASNSFGDVASTPPHLRNIAYTYPLPSETPRQAERSQSHMSRPPVISDQLLHVTPLTSPSVSSTRLTENQYSYPPVLNQGYQSQPYTTDHATPTTNGNYARVDNKHFSPTNWNGNQPRGVVASSTPRAVSYSTVNPSQSSVWSGRSSSSVITVSQATEYPFPTLNSPFYPQAAPMDGNYQGALQYSDSQNQSQGVPTTARHVPQYEDRSYSNSSAEPARYPATYVSESDRDEHVYHQPQPRPVIPRTLPSMVPFSPPLAVTSQLGYWSRDK